MENAAQTRQTRCCIVGGGPAGMMLGLLLARAGIATVILEKHGDFLRDFRGDTVHPSTLEILAELGLKEKFDALPQHRVQELEGIFADGVHALGDFRRLRPFPYICCVPCLPASWGRGSGASTCEVLRARPTIEGDKSGRLDCFLPEGWRCCHS